MQEENIVGEREFEEKTRKERETEVCKSGMASCKNQEHW